MIDKPIQEWPLSTSLIPPSSSCLCPCHSGRLKRHLTNLSLFRLFAISFPPPLILIWQKLILSFKSQELLGSSSCPPRKLANPSFEHSQQHCQSVYNSFYNLLRCQVSPVKGSLSVKTMSCSLLYPQHQAKWFAQRKLLINIC